MAAEIIAGDCLDVLRGMADASVDAVVTDPPYELGFMGKRWDSTGIAYSVELWRECLRVLKPGGHLVAFGGTRTAHRMTCAIEDAGFEVRDSIAWMYGQGFPKSLDVSKAIDKAAGAEREVIGENQNVVRSRASLGRTGSLHTGDTFSGDASTTAPATPAARQWSGWGTALKPAHEPATLARKPLAGTVAANVLAHGTGALNVDACRIEARDAPDVAAVSVNARASFVGVLNGGRISADEPRATTATSSGRWPANVALDEDAAAELDAQSGTLTSGALREYTRTTTPPGYELGMAKAGRKSGIGWDKPADSGGASRFFYCAKASRAERNAGCEGLPYEWTPGAEPKTNRSGETRPIAGTTSTSGNTTPNRGNVHPTVKPLALMRWLCRLVTPPGGLILDPFAGSGSTLVAAVAEGFSAIGIEREPAYVEIARARVAKALADREAA